MESDNIDTKFLQKILILLSCVALFFSINTIMDTYGKYFTKVEEDAEIKIARWRILINGEDVRNNASTKEIITPIFLGNENISSGVIAPHAEGYFDLIIDGSDADVSFKYDISININENSSVKDLIVTGYKIDDGEIIPSTMDDIITGNVPLTQENKIINVRVFIKWDDGESSSMTNEDDTTATGSGINAKLDVSLNFTQIII